MKLGGRHGSERKLQYKMCSEARITLFRGDMGEGALHREDEGTVRKLSSYLTGNSFLFRYKAKPVNAV
jgi:hypothetical protein